MHRMVCVRFLPLVLLVACARMGPGTSQPPAVAAAPAPSGAPPAAQVAATPAAQPVPASAAPAAPVAQAAGETVAPPSAPKSTTKAKPSSTRLAEKAKTPAKEERAAPPEAPPAAQQPPPPPALDLAGLENRLRNTNAIGVFTKLSLKNNVDDLLMAFRAFYNGTLRTTLADLRQRYDGLVMKVLTLVQNGDPTLAQAIAGSRDAIWGILSDRQKFQQFSLK